MFLCFCWCLFYVVDICVFSCGFSVVFVDFVIGVFIVFVFLCMFVSWMLVCFLYDVCVVFWGVLAKRWLRASRSGVAVGLRFATCPLRPHTWAKKTKIHPPKSHQQKKHHPQTNRTKTQHLSLTSTKHTPKIHNHTKPQNNRTTPKHKCTTQRPKKQRFINTKETQNKQKHNNPVKHTHKTQKHNKQKKIKIHRITKNNTQNHKLVCFCFVFVCVCFCVFLCCLCCVFYLFFGVCVCVF